MRPRYHLTMIHLGPRLMHNRPALEMKAAMVVYNVYQALFNIFMVVSFLREVRRTGMPWWGSRVDRSLQGRPLAFLLYAHYHNKYVEFLDTFFMVVRKKQRQLTFLHIYHHALMVWSWYAVLVFAPGGDAWFGACLNSFIHVCMYLYYLAAAYNVCCPWKKYLTQMQMIQFGLCGIHSAYLLCFCDPSTYPVSLIILQAFVMMNMLLLFGNFYRKSY